MPGLIQSAQQTSTNPLDPNAPKLSSTGYDAGQIELDEDKDTVEGRINGIIARNSPLMQQASTKAAQTANQRGLLNSSMAVQAGQAAVYDKAMPIAQQDANTSYDANKTNVGATNTANQFNAQGVQQLEQIGANVAGQQAIATQQAGIDSTLQAEKGAIDLNLQNNDGSIRGSLLQQQIAGDSRLLAERAQNDLALQSADGEIRAGLLQRQGEIDQELTQLRGQIETSLQERQAQLQTGLQNNQGDIESQLTLLKQEGAKELANVEYQWRSILQTNQSAAYFFSETSGDIGAILANPDIPAASKNGLINAQRDLLADGLAVIGGISNLDLNSLLNGGTTGNGGVGAGSGSPTNPIVVEPITGEALEEWLAKWRGGPNQPGGLLPGIFGGVNVGAGL